MNEQALKARIKKIADEIGCPAIETMNKLYLERFLARLSKSKYRDKFIFKGGMLLANYIRMSRETKDIDFTVDGVRSEPEAVKNILDQICAIELKDNMVMKVNKVQRSQERKEYPGLTANIIAQCFNMRKSLYVDISFGDSVIPREIHYQTMSYGSKSLYDDEVTLRAYPPEFIFSEKLETLISWGSENTRMKDYQDLYMLTESNILDYAKLSGSIHDTFKHRGTELKLPINFDDDAVLPLQAAWTNHYNSLDDPSFLPNDVNAVIDRINDLLIKTVVK